MEQKKPQFRKNCFSQAGFYTLLWFMVPMCVYSSSTLFSRFCRFHTKIFKLEGKTTLQLVSIATLVSIFYSTIGLNLYYRGLLAILGLNSIYDVEGVFSQEIIKRYDLDKPINSYTPAETEPEKPEDSDKSPENT
jgi:hypothetical protein